MKGLVALALALTAVAQPCAPAQVYLMDSPVDSQAGVPVLSDHQSQLALAQFMGASRYLDAASPEDIAVVQPLVQSSKTSWWFSSDRPSPTVVIVDSVQPQSPLFDRPASFHMDHSPELDLAETHLNRILHELGTATGMLRTLVAEGVSVLAHGLIPRQVDDSLSHLPSSLALELAKLRALRSSLAHNGVAVVRLSLAAFEGSEYDQAVAAVREELAELAADVFRLAVVAVPVDACEKREQVVKRQASSTSSLSASDDPVDDDMTSCPNNCNGHGKCVKNTLGNFVCVCTSTYDSDKRRTTHWGGSACEKVDVSVEFQMFFWTGLGLIALVVGGIRMLGDVGSQPLPGVLNVAKKA